MIAKKTPAMLGTKRAVAGQRPQTYFIIMLPKGGWTMAVSRKEKRTAAKKSEWSRIRENREFQAAIREIRRKYNIPPGLRFSDQVRLMDSADFLFSVHVLRDEFEIPKDFPLFQEIFSSPAKKISYDPGFPVIRGGTNTPEDQIDVTHADMTDLEVIEFIKLWQSIHDDPPPQPAPIPGNRHKKLDWRPVWEWNMRHPEVTRKQLAAMLHYSYDFIQKILSGYDIENL